MNAIDPARICIGGEITTARDLIEASVRAGLAERALTPSAGAGRLIVFRHGTGGMTRRSLGGGVVGDDRGAEG